MAGNGLTFNGVSGNTITLNGNLSTTNSSGVTFSNGTTLLSGSSNTYNGATTITNGTLKPTKATNLPSATNVTLNAGTLNLNGYSQSIASVSSLVPASDLVTTAGSCTLTVTPTADTTYAGEFSGPINLRKNGSKTFILSGNNALSASVTTTINAGTLQIGNGGTTGTLQGNVADNSVLAFSRSDDVSFGGNISGTAGSVVKQGTNTLVFTGTNSYGGGTTINGGTLQIGNGGTTGSIAGAVTVNSGTLAFARSDNTSFSGAISGAGGVTKYCASRLTLSGSNSYSGTTVVAGGTLELAASAQSCVLTGGGLDLQAGKVVFDYSTGADPIATITSLLSASRDGGKWDTGQFRDSTAAASGLTLGVLDDPTTNTVTVMATYAGDFNLDGTVDNLDRQIWFSSAFTGSSWQQGDANGDGVVNGLDRDILISNLGLTAPATSTSPATPTASMAASAAAAPEPGTLALLAAGLMGLLAFAWRQRR
jgi:autotransporter-associated beta strand protein